MNLFDINSCQMGWIYVTSPNGGVDKVYGDIFGQSNVMSVAPGDLINVHNATNNYDYFFVTAHGSKNINNPISSVQVNPIRTVNGLSFATYTVPRGVYYISIAFIKSLANKICVSIGHKIDYQNSMVISCLGDSITHGYIAPNVWANPTYPEIIANRLNCIVNNYGYSGTGVCDGSDESFVARLNRMPETWLDCLVILGGTNDFGCGYARSLGGIGDAPKQGHNFYASFKYLIQSAIIKYPMARLLVVTPLQRADNGRNRYGICLEDIVRAEKEVAQLYGIACFDYYHEGGMNPALSAQVRYTSDGLHPTQECINLFLGPTIAGEVKRLIEFRGGG